ncbi:MAG: serine protease [Hyphomonadaceae bacterium]|nr:serine protease [Hyphomonadaceae bacterium]
MRFLPDWLVYAIAIGAIVFALFSLDRREMAPPAAPDAPAAGQALPPPSVYDPELLVNVGPAESGMGTAFAISSDGWWLTARHVVDSCRHVGVIVSRGMAVNAEVRVARFADLALLRTKYRPEALALNVDENALRLGQRAYHVGFPQGRTGEATSLLIGRERLISRGRYALDEPILAWAEVGRTEGLRGTLSGISGGPALDSAGRVIGVTIAESTRRGRIYTAAPSTIARLLDVEEVEADGGRADQLTSLNYGTKADEMRRDLTVAQIVCVADPGAAS